MGGFDYRANYDALPIGSVVQSPLNLEGGTYGKWIALDGRDCLRSEYPMLSSFFPAGVFTSTARTLNAIPAASVIAADSTNFLCPGVEGTSPLQTSANGITWVSGSTWGASTQLDCAIVAGSRWIIGGRTGDLTSPHVAATGLTAAQLHNKANWTVTTNTGGGFNGGNYGLAYSPQLARTVMLTAGSSSFIYTLEDGATAWVSRSHTTARTKSKVVWTGSVFLVMVAGTPNLLMVSSDGITWTERFISHSFYGGEYGSIASNGRGLVVICAYNNAQSAWFLVSKDHGTTWRRMIMSMSSCELFDSGKQTFPATTLSFTNGKFFCSGDSNYSRGIGYVLVSSDGITWQEDSIGQRGAATTCRVIAYKGGVYCGLFGGYQATTSSLTFTEDASRFRLHHLSSSYGSADAIIQSPYAIQAYMKVRM